MKITLTESEFINRFLAIRPENFSREALREIFHWIEQLESDIGEETEFDPIAICCDWTEYATILEAAKSYSYNGAEDEDKAAQWLADNTTCLELSEGCVMLNF